MNSIVQKVATAQEVLQSEDEYYFSSRYLIPYFPNELLDDPKLFERSPWSHYKDWTVPVSERFIELLMGLPREIRKKIYRLMALSRNRHLHPHRYPVNRGQFRYSGRPAQGSDFLPYGFFGCECNSTSSYALALRSRGNASTYDNLDKPINKNPCSSIRYDIQQGINTTREEGRLHFIETIDESTHFYHNIIGFLYRLAKYEGLRFHEELDWVCTSKKRADLGATRDFLKWFWTEATLYLDQSFGGILAFHHSQFLSACDNYKRIENLVLELQEIQINDIDKSLCCFGERKFSQICSEISENLPNIQSLTLIANIHMCQIQDLVDKPEKDWNVFAIRNIVVWKHFEVQLRLGFICDRRRDRMANRHPDTAANLVICDEDKEMIRGNYQEALRHWLMPISLRNNDEIKPPKPIDVGIKRLCCKQAQYVRDDYAVDDSILELAPHPYCSGKRYCTCLQGDYY